MVNIKTNSTELSVQKFKSLINATTAITEERAQKINKISSTLKERQLVLQKNIDYLNKLVDSFNLNKQESQEICFLQFFLHSCQQQNNLILFILENISHVMTAVKICSSPINQGPVTPDLLRSNLPLLNNFVLSLQKIDLIYKFFIINYQSIKDNLEKFYNQLVKRHTIDNIKISSNIIITDFCCLFLSAAKQKDENFKLNLIQNDLKNSILQDYLQDSHLFDADLEGDLKFLVKTANSLQNELASDIFEIKNIVGSSYTADQEFKSHHATAIINQIKNLNISNIEYKENNSKDLKNNFKAINYFIEASSIHLLNQSLTSAEAYAECMSEAERAESLTSAVGFYTCKIGSGNAETKEAAGALELVPGEKPNVTLDNIVGSGFEEIKNFISAIKFTSQWSDLFLATSPSKTTDKSNVLLVGPPGCGKTEILRAVASDQDSISVFAQGSDFLTCWRGEAEKNPKRLFEEGVKLHKQSKKQVHFLIDEIDSVLSSNNKPGEVNLSLEFQVLMDGVINYSGLSVWGATNFLERIPPAMVRRFNKVSIVGELSQTDRVTLLKHFINFMPCKGFDNSSWEQCAEKLNGATGNVIRKVADHVWRDKMTEFVNKFPEQASDLVKWLNSQGKFDINNFSSENKEELKERLLNYTAIDPQYLNKIIDSYLKNLAIRSEIQVAVNTYENAKRILNQL